MNVKLGWLMNTLIDHTKKGIIFYESDGRPESKKQICLKNDEYYECHKMELWERKIYFISIRNDNIEIYVRPEGWPKKK